MDSNTKKRVDMFLKNPDSLLGLESMIMNLGNAYNICNMFTPHKPENPEYVVVETGISIVPHVITEKRDVYWPLYVKHKFGKGSN